MSRSLSYLLIWNDKTRQFCLGKNNFGKDYGPEFSLKPSNVFKYYTYSYCWSQMLSTKTTKSCIVSLFNMLFEVNPSVRSPVKCDRCLRFGRTQKSNAEFRSDPTCSHCGGDRHSIDVCPTVQTTDPVCLFRCKLPRLTAGRNSYERVFQNEIEKKITVTEDMILRKTTVIPLFLNTFKYGADRQRPVSVNSPDTNGWLSQHKYR